MNKQQLRHLLDDVKNIRVAVLGDFCLDAYYFLNSDAAEISVETGLPTRPVQSMRLDPGGAGTIVNNLVSIGVGSVMVFGLVGDDLFGRELRQLFRQKQVDVSGLKIQPKGWVTHVYTKLYEREDELPRVDIGNFNEVDSALAESLLIDLEQALPDIDVVIINQQIKHGIHTRVFINRLVDLISRADDTIFIADSRDYLDQYTGAIHKLNEYEAVKTVQGSEEASPLFDLPLRIDDAQTIAQKLYQQWGTPVFLTRGNNGCVVCHKNTLHIIPGLEITGQTDPVGAGDSLLAGIAAALGAGKEPSIAAEFGNFMAGVTVQKRFQTGTASPAEVLAIGNKPNYRYNPEIAASNQYRTCPNSDIEIISSMPVTPNIKYAIFDHDGTISVLRQGWENLMATVMVQSILGQHRQSVTPHLLNQIETTVYKLIDQTTGIPTLGQMEGLVELVVDFKFVPDNEILQAWEYKKIYNTTLTEFVQNRIDKVEAGEMDVPDYTIKNAIPFLQALSSRGVTLILASGTDEQDVKQEATLMGYADLFSGGIFGARDGEQFNPKNAALRQVLALIGGENAEQIISFGDGPAEMREMRKAGGIAVGVASDEIRRHGLNAAKRSRLVLSGADLVIPDFSQMKTLLNLLF